jgi:DNA-binding transcriptional LysR family regulator
VTVDQLRRFVTLAEELSFTRASRRLHITQQVLSAQIKQLEREVGTRLFDRTTHRVALTPAGEELVAAARDALASLEAGIEAARRLGETDAPRLRIGFVAQGASELQAPLLRELRRRFPRAAVEMRSFAFSDPLGGLLTGESDVAILPNPPTHPGVRLERILDEPRICLVPVDHPLAAREALTPGDLAGLPAIVIRGHDTDPLIRRWIAAHTLVDVVGPRPVGAVVETPEEWLQAAEAGLGFTTTPASVVRFYPRPGLRAVPVEGAGPLALVHRVAAGARRHAARPRAPRAGQGGGGDRRPAHARKLSGGVGPQRLIVRVIRSPASQRGGTYAAPPAMWAMSAKSSSRSPEEGSRR